MKKKVKYKKMLDKGVTNFQGVRLELENGRKVLTSPVVGYSDGIIETQNTIYIRSVNGIM